MEKDSRKFHQNLLEAALRLRMALFDFPQNPRLLKKCFVACLKCQRPDWALQMLLRLERETKPKGLAYWQYQRIKLNLYLAVGQTQKAAGRAAFLFRSHEQRALKNKGICVEAMLACLQNGDYAKLLSLSQKVVDKYPRLSSGHIAKVQALMGMGETGAALAYCNKMTSVFKDAYPLFTLKGKIYLEKGYLDYAEQAFEKALGIFPGDLQAWEGKIKTKLEMGQVENAVKEILHILKTTRNPAFCEYLKGLLPEERKKDVVLDIK